jgi:hypothetical protein
MGWVRHRFMRGSRLSFNNLILSCYIAMHAAAPEGTPPRRFDDRNQKYFTTYLPLRTDFLLSMTTRPHLSESCRGPVCVAVGLCIVMVAVLLAAGCTDQTDERNVTIGSEKSHSNAPDPDVKNFPSSAPTLVYGDEAHKNLLLHTAPNMVYEQNMAEWKKKLPISLVELIDPDYPVDEKSRQFTRANLICYNAILPPEKAAIKFNATNSSAENYGEYVIVNIILNQSAQTRAVDPYVQKIEQRTPYVVTGWVELMNNIEKIASLSEVQRIDLVYPTMTGSSWYECRNGTLVYVQFGH